MIFTQNDYNYIYKIFIKEKLWKSVLLGGYSIYQFYAEISSSLKILLCDLYTLIAFSSSFPAFFPSK